MGTAGSFCPSTTIPEEDPAHAGSYLAVAPAHHSHSKTPSDKLLSTGRSAQVGSYLPFREGVDGEV